MMALCAEIAYTCLNVPLPPPTSPNMTWRIPELMAMNSGTLMSVKIGLMKRALSLTFCSMLAYASSLIV